MRIVAISDTHQHHDLNLPEGDVLIHAGDFSRVGTIAELRRFAEWFRLQPHPIKIVVAGNHDMTMENTDNRHYLEPRGVHYMEGDGMEIQGVRFWGTPYSRFFGPRWAFGHQDGTDRYFQQIPDGTDVLITHGPPARILDTCPGGQVGSEDLRERVEMVRPVLHVFGHIHESHGMHSDGWTTYINVSICDGRYNPVNHPTVVDLEDGPDGLVVRG